MNKRFVHVVTGSRGTKTGKKLWTLYKETNINKVATDYWKPYQEFVPVEKHIITKAETFTVEGYNSLLRHFLARLRRKSKCYSKSQKMLEYSVRLFMTEWNERRDIIKSTMPN